MLALAAMLPCASDRCELVGCSLPAAAAYAVEFEGARPLRYVSLCAGHNRHLLRHQGSVVPEAVLAFVSAAADAVAAST